MLNYLRLNILGSFLCLAFFDNISVIPRLWKGNVVENDVNFQRFDIRLGLVLVCSLYCFGEFFEVDLKLDDGNRGGSDDAVVFDPVNGVESQIQHIHGVNNQLPRVQACGEFGGWEDAVNCDVHVARVNRQLGGLRTVDFEVKRVVEGLLCDLLDP